jgi:hypothetical protein
MFAKRLKSNNSHSARDLETTDPCSSSYLKATYSNSARDLEATDSCSSSD